MSAPHLSLIIQEHISLKDKNTFGTGGVARFFTSPTTIEHYQNVLLYAHKQQLTLCLLGEGANTLISDDDFDGIVIRPSLARITIIDEEQTSSGCCLIRAEAGVSMNTLIEWCLDHNLVGLEEFSGIPGTVGGSVYINLHYFDILLEHFLVSACVIAHDGSHILAVDKDWFQFGYNSSKLHNGAYYLVDATLRLKQATESETAFARGRRKEIIRHRLARYPSTYTCGSFFRNFYEHEVSLVINNKKAIWTAYYFDKLGIKGSLQVGPARVSHQHANMIVHDGTATTADIIELARQMQKLVFDEFGIIPQPECRLVGFKTYPLMQ